MLNYCLSIYGSKNVSKKGGFSLLELIMITGIIAFMTIIAIPVILNYSKQKQKESEAATTSTFNQTELARSKEFSNMRDIPIKNLIFYREPRVPGLCVAHGWVGYSDGGPVAFEVNCEKVASLLINPLPKTKPAAEKPTCPPNCDSL